jgi:hypothetical protein
MELDGMNVGDSIQVHDEIGQTGVPNDPLVPATPTWRTGNSPGEWGGGPYLSANHLKSSSKGWNTWRKAKRNIDDIEVSWSCKKNKGKFQMVDYQRKNEWVQTPLVVC